MVSLESILKENPDLKLLSKTKLKKRLENQGVKKEEIDEHFNPTELHQVYAKPKKYKPLKITALPYSFQIDVAFLPSYKKQNNGIDAFFICVDILSRKAFAYPLKSRKMKDILEVYEKFIDDVDEPINSVAGDDEFNNTEFKAFNSKMDIQVFTDVAKDDHIVKGKGDKLGIVDRCIRTLKQYIQKYMLAHEDLKWTTYIHKLIDLYNDTSNNGIKDMTPNEVFDDYDYMIGLYKGQKSYNKEVSESFDLKVGDQVRIMLGKGTFEKEKQKFSSEIYTIIERVCYKYILKDEKGNAVKRKYRPSELLKVTKVTERLGKVKEKVEKSHKHVTKVRNALGKSYEAASDAIEQSKEPRPVRAKKKVDRLDL